MPRLRLDAFYVALAGSIVASSWRLPGGTWARPAAAEQAPQYPAEMFTGMLMFDGMTVYFRSVLLLFAVLFMRDDAAVGHS